VAPSPWVPVFFSIKKTLLQLEVPTLSSGTLLVEADCQRFYDYPFPVVRSTLLCGCTSQRCSILSAETKVVESFLSNIAHKTRSVRENWQSLQFQVQYGIVVGSYFYRKCRRCPGVSNEVGHINLSLSRGFWWRSWFRLTNNKARDLIFRIKPMVVCELRVARTSTVPDAHQPI
jgi:hypothetical protein